MSPASYGLEPDLHLRAVEIAKSLWPASCSVDQNADIILEELRKVYLEGMKAGIWRFAYMKDGVYYVGTTGRIYKEEIKRIDEEMIA